MKKLLFASIFFLFSTPVLFACSIRAGIPPPINKTNLKPYIFIGEVVGYTDNIKARVKPDGWTSEDKFFGEGRGLKIKPLEVINLPDVPNDYFELFSFGVTPWCAPKLHSIDLPIGTKLRVISYESTLLPNRNADNKVRLEHQIFDYLSVIKDNDEFVTAINSEFDYKNNWKTLANKFAVSKDYEKVIAFNDFIYVETAKDILRLEKTTSKKERYAILERLLYNPKVDFPALISLGQKKIKLTSTEKKLLKQRAELENSAYFRI